MFRNLVWTRSRLNYDCGAAGFRSDERRLWWRNVLSRLSLVVWGFLCCFVLNSFISTKVGGRLEPRPILLSLNHAKTNQLPATRCQSRVTQAEPMGRSSDACGPIDAERWPVLVLRWTFLLVFIPNVSHLSGKPFIFSFFYFFLQLGLSKVESEVSALGYSACRRRRPQLDLERRRPPGPRSEYESVARPSPALSQPSGDSAFHQSGCDRP